MVSSLKKKISDSIEILNITPLRAMRSLFPRVEGFHQPRHVDVQLTDPAGFQALPGIVQRTLIAERQPKDIA